MAIEQSQQGLKTLFGRLSNYFRGKIDHESQIKTPDTLDTLAYQIVDFIKDNFSRIREHLKLENDRMDVVDFLLSSLENNLVSAETKNMFNPKIGYKSLERTYATETESESKAGLVIRCSAKTKQPTYFVISGKMESSHPDTVIKFITPTQKIITSKEVEKYLWSRKTQDTEIGIYNDGKRIVINTNLHGQSRDTTITFYLLGDLKGQDSEQTTLYVYIMKMESSKS